MKLKWPHMYLLLDMTLKASWLRNVVTARDIQRRKRTPMHRNVHVDHLYSLPLKCVPKSWKKTLELNLSIWALSLEKNGGLYLQKKNRSTRIWRKRTNNASIGRWRNILRSVLPKTPLRLNMILPWPQQHITLLRRHRFTMCMPTLLSITIIMTMVITDITIRMPMPITHLPNILTPVIPMLIMHRIPGIITMLEFVFRMTLIY
mmetsp:Transcript_31306/g.66153  ORF Transcript_31306/g.66153 Transcript_31306/m.66153 type:complete len:204 (-) Transcript_31306:355-966(-)